MFSQNSNKMLVEMLDVFGTAILGVTLAPVAAPIADQLPKVVLLLLGVIALGLIVISRRMRG